MTRPIPTKCSEHEQILWHLAVAAIYQARSEYHLERFAKIAGRA